MTLRSTTACLALLLLLPSLSGCDAGESSSKGGHEEGSGGAAAATGGQAGAGGEESGASQAACDPTGNTTMVSLTYDDTLPSQLANAVPALEAHKLTATFFVTNVSGGQSTWGKLLDKGHELAAHTLNHPCPKADWVQPGMSSQEYDLARIEAELDDNVEQLLAMGQKAPLTFAYPCGIDWVGEEKTSYVDSVKTRFSAARGVTPGVITTLKDEYHVPAYFQTGTGASLIALVDQARALKGWIVFGFHGVGGDHSAVSLEAHEALLAYLEEQGSAVRVLPFGPAVECMKSR